MFSCVHPVHLPGLLLPCESLEQANTLQAGIRIEIGLLHSKRAEPAGRRGFFRKIMDEGATGVCRNKTKLD